MSLLHWNNNDDVDNIFLLKSQQTHPHSNGQPSHNGEFHYSYNNSYQGDLGGVSSGTIKSHENKPFVTSMYNTLSQGSMANSRDNVCINQTYLPHQSVNSASQYDQQHHVQNDSYYPSFQPYGQVQLYSQQVHGDPHVSFQLRHQHPTHLYPSATTTTGTANSTARGSQSSNFPSTSYPFSSSSHLQQTATGIQSHLSIPNGIVPIANNTPSTAAVTPNTIHSSKNGFKSYLKRQQIYQQTQSSLSSFPNKKYLSTNKNLPFLSSGEHLPLSPPSPSLSPLDIDVSLLQRIKNTALFFPDVIKETPSNVNHLQSTSSVYESPSYPVSSNYAPTDGICANNVVSRPALVGNNLQFWPFPCDEFDTVAQSPCRLGDRCPLAHTIYEIVFHPAFYRACMCNLGSRCLSLKGDHLDDQDTKKVYLCPHAHTVTETLHESCRMELYPVQWVYKPSINGTIDKIRDLISTLNWSKLDDWVEQVRSVLAHPFGSRGQLGTIVKEHTQFALKNSSDTFKYNFYSYNSSHQGTNTHSSNDENENNVSNSMKQSNYYKNAESHDYTSQNTLSPDAIIHTNHNANTSFENSGSFAPVNIRSSSSSDHNNNATAITYADHNILSIQNNSNNNNNNKPTPVLKPIVGSSAGRALLCAASRPPPPPIASTPSTAPLSSPPLPPTAAPSSRAPRVSSACVSSLSPAVLQARTSTVSDGTPPPVSSPLSSGNLSLLQLRVAANDKITEEAAANFNFRLSDMSAEGPSTLTSPSAFLSSKLKIDMERLTLLTFKIFPCRFRVAHDRKACVFYHSSRDRRRVPFTYSSTLCVRAGNGPTVNCSEGDSCSLSHNRLEHLYHPDNFKVRLCASYPDISSCQRSSFCAFAHCREERVGELFSEQEESERSCRFFMDRFKTLWCPFGVQHDWHACLYAHTYQDCRRALTVGYGSEPCPHWDRNLHLSDYSKRCSSGYSCPYAHGSKEQLYHPCYFRTMPCADYRSSGGTCPRGELCAFFHESKQKRIAIPLNVITASIMQQAKDLEEQNLQRFNNERQKNNLETETNVSTTEDDDMRRLEDASTELLLNDDKASSLLSVPEPSPDSDPLIAQMAILNAILATSIGRKAIVKGPVSLSQAASLDVFVFTPFKYDTPLSSVDALQGTFTSPPTFAPTSSPSNGPLPPPGTVSVSMAGKADGGTASEDTRGGLLLEVNAIGGIGPSFATIRAQESTQKDAEDALQMLLSFPCQTTSASVLSSSSQKHNFNTEKGDLTLNTSENFFTIITSSEAHNVESMYLNPTDHFMNNNNNNNINSSHCQTQYHSQQFEKFSTVRNNPASMESSSHFSSSQNLFHPMQLQQQKNSIIQNEHPISNRNNKNLYNYHSFASSDFALPPAASLYPSDVSTSSFNNNINHMHFSSNNNISMNYQQQQQQQMNNNQYIFNMTNNPSLIDHCNHFQVDRQQQKQETSPAPLEDDFFAFLPPADLCDTPPPASSSTLVQQQQQQQQNHSTSNFLHQQHMQQQILYPLSCGSRSAFDPTIGQASFINLNQHSLYNQHSINGGGSLLNSIFSTANNNNSSTGFLPPPTVSSPISNPQAVDMMENGAGMASARANSSEMPIAPRHTTSTTSMSIQNLINNQQSLIVHPNIINYSLNNKAMINNQSDKNANLFFCNEDDDICDDSLKNNIDLPTPDVNDLHHNSIITDTSNLMVNIGGSLSAVTQPSIGAISASNSNVVAINNNHI